MTTRLRLTSDFSEALSIIVTGQGITRKPTWRKGYARQRHHSKVAVSRYLGYYQTANSSIRSTDPENPCL